MKKQKKREECSVNEKQKSSLVTYTCAVCFASVVAFASIANKMCTPYAVPVLVLFCRYLLSFTGNLALQKLGVIRVSVKGKGQKRNLVITAVVYVASHLSQIVGLMYAPSIYGGITFATVPIWAEVLALVILKEKTTMKQNLFMMISILSVIAMLLIGSRDGMGTFSMKGFVFLLMGCFCEAVNNVMIRFLKREYTAMEISFTSGAISLVLIAVVFVIQMVTGIMTPEMIFTPLKDVKFLLGVVYLGIGCTLVSGLTKGYILQHMSALKASAWSNVSTALTVIAGVVIMKEPFYLYQAVCTIGIVGGVIGIQICKEKSVEEDACEPLQ